MVDFPLEIDFSALTAVQITVAITTYSVKFTILNSTTLTVQNNFTIALPGSTTFTITFNNIVNPKSTSQSSPFSFYSFDSSMQTIDMMSNYNASNLMVEMLYPNSFSSTSLTRTSLTNRGSGNYTISVTSMQILDSNSNLLI